MGVCVYVCTSPGKLWVTVQCKNRTTSIEMVRNTHKWIGMDIDQDGQFACEM